MPHTRSLALGACLAFSAFAPAVAAADITSPETLALNSYRAGDASVTLPVTTSGVLDSGGFYAIEVRGTYAAYNSELMSNPYAPYVLCGMPESGPLYPSPGRDGSPAGSDAEYVFSAPARNSCTPDPRGATGQFQIDTGGGAGHYAANGAPYTSPRADHAYVYLVRGNGQPASVLLRDRRVSDNNGILAVTVRKATGSDCGTNAACIATAPAVEPATPPSLNPAGGTTTPGVTTPGTGTGTTPGTGTGTGTTTPVKPGSGVSAKATLSLATAKHCVSRRRFLIRVVTRKVDPVVKAIVRVRGKRIKVASVKRDRHFRRVSFIDLRGLPAGRFKVTITATTRSGVKLTGTRTYVTCKAKATKKSTHPAL